MIRAMSPKGDFFGQEEGGDGKRIDAIWTAQQVQTARHIPWQAAFYFQLCVRRGAGDFATRAAH